MGGVIRSSVGLPIALKARMQMATLEVAGDGDRANTLYESEERFRLMVEGSEQVFFYAHDLEHRIEYVSPSVASVLGYSPEYYIGKQYEVMLTGDPSDAIVTQLTDDALRRGSGRSIYSMVARHLDGRSIVLELVESPLVRKGKVVGMQGFARDITDRRNSERALWDTSQTLQALVEASPLAIVTVDLERRVKTWNPAAERLFGWRFEEVRGHVVPHVPREKLTEFQRIRDNPRGGEYLHFETQRLKKDGAVIEVAVAAAGLHSANGELSGMMGIYTDTSERRKLEEQFRQSQKMEAVGQLAGGVAHDFNNILTVISAYSDLLRDALRSDDPRQADVREIRKAAERATGLTAQLLAFSRRQVVNPRVLDLNQVVAEMENMLRRLLREDVELRTVLATGLARIRADAGQLEQVLMNLAVNARDAMPDGGTITIETRNAPRDPANPLADGMVRQGDGVELLVSDTGCGMDAETQAHLFEPFFTTKEVGRGTGLGLATVYGIVKQSGGSLEVLSTPGLGSSFCIRFPMVGGSALDAHLPMPDTKPATGNETILLVEDDKAVRRLVRRGFTELGYTLVEAADGIEALRVSSEYRKAIHLLVTDVVMPGMNGRDIATRLSQLRPEMKVLFMSGYSDGAVPGEGLPPGAALVQKPFSMDALGCAIREILDAT